ncbi:MAG: hypothetical protein KIB00_16860 [Paeniclostridium sordellii]|nr:hypothetical protein [Paeniclostridium sordellii]
MKDVIQDKLKKFNLKNKKKYINEDLVKSTMRVFENKSNNDDFQSSSNNCKYCIYGCIVNYNIIRLKTIFGSNSDTKNVKDKSAIINVGRKNNYDLNDNQIRFYIGHEIAHIKYADGAIDSTILTFISTIYNEEDIERTILHNKEHYTKYKSKKEENKIDDIIIKSILNEIFCDIESARILQINDEDIVDLFKKLKIYIDSNNTLIKGYLNCDDRAYMINKYKINNAGIKKVEFIEDLKNCFNREGIKLNEELLNKSIEIYGSEFEDNYND